MKKEFLFTKTIRLINQSTNQFIIQLNVDKDYKVVDLNWVDPEVDKDLDWIEFDKEWHWEVGMVNFGKEAQHIMEVD